MAVGSLVLLGPRQVGLELGSSATARPRAGVVVATACALVAAGVVTAAAACGTLTPVATA